jgi:predicted CoA-substrate-specific enzyme activase
MKYSLGMDVGSVNVKLCLIDDGDRIVRLDSEKIATNPKAAINTLLLRLAHTVPLDAIDGAGVSGLGRGAIPAEFNWAEYSSSLAIASGLLNLYPETKTIIQIGGQTSLVIVLEDGLRKPWKVTSNPLCAAGTGRFIVQQAYRLGISLDDFSRLALECRDKPPRIAARCSVFAKSDLIHLQQKGVSMEAMLYALCESIARMVASLKKGAFDEPIHFIGGVAANSAIVRALKEVLSARTGHEVEVNVPQDYLYIEALGTALLSKEKSSGVRLLPEADARQDYFEMPRLEKVALPGNGTNLKITEPCSGYLGVDVGSTSTKAVIIDESGKVLAKNYLMTAGRPIDAVKQVFRNLLLDGADRVKIAGVGVTGSGRYLVGSFIGADLIKNEITAQTWAAAEIDPEADIIEIGGQDSKLVIKRNGVVVDYQMNKACAAGTGSFIDELAEMLDISVHDGQFADLSFNAPHTIDLGTRCAAFMGQAVASTQQEGVPLEVITASLANSIAKNYLSKVVGHRKLGDRVILAGAVFYNQAVVSAFNQQLEDKTLTVAEHREVSGAIGAALLARETVDGDKSHFKGFEQAVKNECKLSTFLCQGCDNNCTITRMHLPDEKATFYGSRCDRYDSTISQARQKTAFDEREKLLFRGYKEDTGTGPTVGIPRALLAYDYAPLLIGFLNALDARVIMSTKTTKEIMEQSVELSYTDSCFPLKLLHGHIAAIADRADYILYPCFLRLGGKEGAENQKYACPLVQASPFIVRHVLNLGERLLTPIVDFSLGDEETAKNLTDVAARLGFDRKRGREAALAGIEAQRKFKSDCLSLGNKLLQQLRDRHQLGVVIFSRSYMSQDSGANLGIAEKLAQLGVVPVPLDFLPLESVNPKEYSDRPYWHYESKFIAGGAMTVEDPQLYGLAITNFGCGPNSFMLKMLADIMGGKPLGELEIDEHAAEAGIVTRLEAYVDTIASYAQTEKHVPEKGGYFYRGASATINPQKTLLLPRMCPHADVLAEAINASGARAIALPESDERSLLLSNQVTSGTECLPYRVTLGDFLKFCYDCGDSLKNYEGFMAGAYGPCRLGKYVVEQGRILKEFGFDLPMITSVSNNAYRDLNLKPGFTRLVWNGIVAVDGLQRLLWRTRPYEKEKGSAEALFDEFLQRIAGRIRNREPYYDVLQQATAAFKSIIDPTLPPRPLIGINGEIYLRSNAFSNRDLVKACEEAGLEVIVSPVGEWMKYTAHRNLEDAVKDKNFKKVISSYVKKLIQERDEHRVSDHYRELLDGREPSTAAILAKSDMYLSPRCGSEAVLSIGSGVEWMESPVFAGVISVMPHGCMPGGIVAAMAERFSAVYQKPWISLTYDGFLETNNAAKISNFAEQLRFCQQETRQV